MSVESARAFVEKMRSDLEFKNQILAAESAAKRQEIIRNAQDSDYPDGDP